VGTGCRDRVIGRTFQKTAVFHPRDHNLYLSRADPRSRSVSVNMFRRGWIGFPTATEDRRPSRKSLARDRNRRNTGGTFAQPYYRENGNGRPARRAYAGPSTPLPDAEADLSVQQMGGIFARIYCWAADSTSIRPFRANRSQKYSYSSCWGTTNPRVVALDILYRLNILRRCIVFGKRTSPLTVHLELLRENSISLLTRNTKI